MAHLTLHNPAVLSARRGRATTVIHLADQDGLPVDLVFTSLPGMSAMADQLTTAAEEMREARNRDTWYNPSPAARIHRKARRAVWGVLQRLGLLDIPYRPF